MPHNGTSRRFWLPALNEQKPFNREFPPWDAVPPPVASPALKSDSTSPNWLVVAAAITLVGTLIVAVAMMFGPPSISSPSLEEEESEPASTEESESASTADPVLVEIAEAEPEQLTRKSELEEEKQKLAAEREKGEAELIRAREEAEEAELARRKAEMERRREFARREAERKKREKPPLPAVPSKAPRALVRKTPEARTYEPVDVWRAGMRLSDRRIRITGLAKGYATNDEKYLIRFQEGRILINCYVEAEKMGSLKITHGGHLVVTLEGVVHRSQGCEVRMGNCEVIWGVDPRSQ